MRDSKNLKNHIDLKGRIDLKDHIKRNISSGNMAERKLCEGSTDKKGLWKRTGLKCLCCLLAVNFVCMALWGCGVRTNEGGQGSPEPTEDSGNSSNGREIVTAVVTWPSRDTLEHIRAYNENSQKYFIEIREYGEESAVMEAEDLETQLTLDILSGKGPDLVIWDSAFYSPALASEKLMENLYGFMEEDADFRREDYYGNILQAFELNGGLYVLPASFSVETVCGKAEEIGIHRNITEGWEIGEMIEAFENSPHAEWLTVNYSKRLAFSEVCWGCVGNFVDWEKGTCHFDTPAFVELLELSDTFPENLTIDNDFSYYETLRSGKALWVPVMLASPWRVADQRISFGDVDMRWPGYPVADGEKELGGGVAAPYGECFSICRNSQNQAAAWEFIKSFLTVEAQREMGGIPLLRTVSEERIQDALTVEYETVDGIEREKIKYRIIAEGEETTGLSCITEEDAEIYRSIIENTHRSYGNDSGMMEIIMEEADAYFEKGKNAAAVADTIQRRVSVYVGERVN